MSEDNTKYLIQIVFSSLKTKILNLEDLKESVHIFITAKIQKIPEEDTDL